MLNETDSKVLCICLISGLVMTFLLFAVNYPIDKGYVVLYPSKYDIRNYKPEWSLTYSLFAIPMGFMIVCIMWLLELDNIYDLVDFKKLKEYYKKELMIYRNK
jgi:hypothetical protein